MAEFRKAELVDVVAIPVNDFVELKVEVNGLYYSVKATYANDNGDRFWNIEMPRNLITNREMKNYDYNIHIQLERILDVEASRWLLQRGDVN